MTNCLLAVVYSGAFFYAVNVCVGIGETERESECNVGTILIGRVYTCLFVHKREIDREWTLVNRQR